MTLNKKQIKELIQQEIDWHKNANHYENKKEWVVGFIKGMKHIKKLFTKIKEQK